MTRSGPSTGLVVGLVAIVFLIGLGVGAAQRLATLPEDDTSWLGTGRDAWMNMYGSMGGSAALRDIEYFVYHPDVPRDHVLAYAKSEPRVADVTGTIYDSASILVVPRENRDVLSEIEGQSWVNFAIRGELMFFCH